LDRISTLFKTDTDNKCRPGAVVMIARNGKVVDHEAFGARDPATGAPTQKDSMFRMYP
jgi:CubicO group peptidase (beta-lactamase class C family)